MTDPKTAPATDEAMIAIGAALAKACPEPRQGRGEDHAEK